MRFNIFNNGIWVAICSLIFCCLIINLSCESTLKPSINIQNKNQLDAILNKYVDEGFYPFLLARLENKNGRVIYEHCRINRNLIPEDVIDENSWIRIWSMSKIVTITLVMDLIEDDILNLSEPVIKYIPEFKNLNVAVDDNGTSLTKVDSITKVCPFNLENLDSVMTLNHLINHEAGFYYATTGSKCLNENMAKLNVSHAKNSKEFINHLSSLPLIQQPGETHFYGTNTTVLGIVAERATGKTLNQLVHDRLTKPLGINGLKYNLDDDETMLPRVTGVDTVLRTANDGELDIFGPDVPRNDLKNELFLGGEGMVATADGYCDYLRMFVNDGVLNGEQFLNTETINEITAPHTQKNSPWGYNGYNLWVTSDTLRKMRWGEEGLWQGGGYEGTQFWIDPKREFVGVIMTQIYHTPNGGWGMYNDFRGALYQQFWIDEQ